MTTRQQDSLWHLLGGGRTALDTMLPAIGFLVGYFAFAQSIAAGVVTAGGLGVVLAGWRLRQGARPQAVVLSLLAVGVAALVVLHTGRAADFFLVRILSNAVSAVAWLASIVVRWPLLGVVVNAVLGQPRRWRRDPVLLRAYRRASWVWVGQYVVRLAVLLPLWAAGQVAATGLSQTLLSWPLVALTLVVSGAVLRRSMPSDHPGLRHPRI